MSTDLKECVKCKKLKNISSFSLTPAKNPRGSCKDCRCAQNRGTESRSRKLQFKYKITHEDYLNILETQNGVCLGCGVKAEEQYHGVLDVDHNHKTGKVRGLLCSTCNRLLGFAGDSVSVLLNLAAYLNKNGSYSD